MERQYIRHRASDKWHIVADVEDARSTGNPKYQTYCHRYYYGKQYEVATVAALPTGRSDDSRVCYDCRAAVAHRQGKRIYHAPQMIEQSIKYLFPAKRGAMWWLLPLIYEYEKARVRRWNAAARAFQQQLHGHSPPP